MTTIYVYDYYLLGILEICFFLHDHIISFGTGKTKKGALVGFSISMKRTNVMLQIVIWIIMHSCLTNRMVGIHVVSSSYVLYI